MKKDFTKKVFTKRKFTSFVLIALYIIVSLVCAFRCYSALSNPTQTFWEVLYYTTQCLSSVFVTGGVLIAVWQYSLSFSDTLKQYKLERVQRAIDLAEYYKDNILPNICAFRYIFEQSGVNNILQNVDEKKFQNFNYSELVEIFTSPKIDELKNLQKSEVFYNSVIKANKIFKLNLTLPVPESTQMNSELAQSDERDIALKHISRLMSTTLNNMEYFALHFRHHTADESVVYQSLHQTYLQTMPYLYYYIANNNHDAVNQLYTNLTWLYKKWAYEKDNQTKNNNNRMKTIPRTGTIMEETT